MLTLLEFHIVSDFGIISTSIFVIAEKTTDEEGNQCTLIQSVIKAVCGVDIWS
jgi:hypothetical protein